MSNIFVLIISIVIGCFTSFLVILFDDKRKENKKQVKNEIKEKVFTDDIKKELDSLPANLHDDFLRSKLKSGKVGAGKKRK